MREQNILDYFVIATGRNLDSFKKAIKMYNIDFFDYAICSNGAIVIDANLTIIDQTSFEEDQLEKLDNQLRYSSRDIKLSEICYWNDKSYSYCLTLVDEKRATEIADKIAAQFLNVTVNNNGIYVDITPFGTGKWIIFKENFEKLTKYYKVCSFGDGANDIDILSNADYSCSFHSANQLAKNTAKKTVTNFEEGLYVAINFFNNHDL